MKESLKSNKFIIFILSTILLLYPFSSYADNNWTKRDTIRQIGFTTFETMDWLQTKKGAENSRYYETNPILGKYPSQGKVNIYFTTCIIGNALIAYLLPTNFNGLNLRAIWQYASIGFEVGYVKHNYDVGIRVGLFRF